jgi:hypothetical protein
LNNLNQAYLKIGEKRIYRTTFNPDTNTIGETFELVFGSDQDGVTDVVLPLELGGVFEGAQSSEFFAITMEDNDYVVKSVQSFN